MTAAHTMPAQAVTVVTQTQVAEGQNEAFASWEEKISATVSGCSGFLDHTVMPPAPPAQPDWVIVERFRSVSDAQAWLASPERHQLLAEIEPLLVGSDDIRFFLGDRADPPPASVTAVISTRVAPEREQAYRAWQRQALIVEATFPGFQGVRLEPPVAGIQDSWVSALRFDSYEHLQAWLQSPERRRLVEAADFDQDEGIRVVRGDLETRFSLTNRPVAATVPAWKQNMILLLVLHPLAFLLAVWVLGPHLINHGVPVSLALFIGAVIKVALLGYLLVPWANRLFGWWLTPKLTAPVWLNTAGVALLLAVYGVGLAIFARFP